MEDKQKICQLLLAALQATRGQSDMVSLDYERINGDTEIVTAKYADGGTRKINVSMDSGEAMIRDIMRGLI